ncbi:uncharacterized protein C9orf40 homolog [Suncus etruscus]|uniref:uncharacterized protein C9orf40 homolog n=1 Tax=Suncus etruscus TaxID=109475 RepID=UPI0021104CEA|nr:uncharacterized protein C9orf40 homolog [Suncus etruscus]
MAKRRAAEPLTFHVPWKRLLLRDGPDEPPPLRTPPGPGQPRGAPPPPRKRKMDAGAVAESSAAPRKRRDGGRPGAQGGGLDAGEAPSATPPAARLRGGPGEELQGARPPRGGGDDGAGRGAALRGDWGVSARQLNEEFWQYNTFQYWRNPLPPIDLADIEAVNEDSLTKVKVRDKNEEIEIDMES